MLTIFHAPGARSLRVIWLAEELGLPYEVRRESLGRPSDEFARINPARALPSIIDGDVVMSESVAIMLYLLGKHGPTPLAPAPDAPDYPLFLQHLIFGEGSLAAYVNPIIYTTFMAPEGQRQNFTVESCRNAFLGRLRVLDGVLAQQSHLVGEDFTAADISVGYALALGERFGLGDGYPSEVREYWKSLQERPAYRRAAEI